MATTPLTREVGGELYTYAFQDWQRYLDYEEEPVSPGADSEESYLYFGLGSRRYARRLIQSGTGHRLYEPDPRRLALLLEEFPDLLDRKNWRVGTGLWLQEGFLGRDLNLLCHPLLKTLYNPLPGLMLDAPEELASEAGLLVQVGDLFYRDVLEALKGRRPVWPLQLGHWSEKGIAKQLSASAAGHFFSINLIDGLADLCAANDTGYVCWEIDPATSPYQDVSNPGAESSRIFTYRKKNIPELKEAGYERSEYCPLASNVDIRRPLETSKLKSYETGVSFVGSSMAQNAERQLNKVLSEIEDRSGSGESWGGLEELVGDWRENPPDWDENSVAAVSSVLERADLPSVLEIDGDPVYLPMALAEYRAHQKRVQVVETVGNSFSLDVWGDRGWEGRVGEQGRYRGQAGHGRELTEIYNASRINLDVNRIYQPEIITMRVFDAMACGSVVLTQVSEEVQELLEPGSDCFVYSAPDDLLGTIETLLGDESRLREVGRRARRTIVGAHSIEQRLESRVFDF